MRLWPRDSVTSGTSRIALSRGPEPHAKRHPAKVTRPRLHHAIAREPLHSRLDDALACGAVWLSAPPGAGKTTGVAGYLDRRGLAGIWYQIDAGDGYPVFSSTICALPRCTATTAHLAAEPPAAHCRVPLGSRRLRPTVLPAVVRHPRPGVRSSSSTTFRRSRPRAWSIRRWSKPSNRYRETAVSWPSAAWHRRRRMRGCWRTSVSGASRQTRCSTRRTSRRASRQRAFRRSPQPRLECSMSVARAGQPDSPCCWSR